MSQTGKARVAIGGITGYVGRNLGRILEKSGKYEIYGISRNPSNSLLGGMNVKECKTWDDFSKHGFELPMDIIANFAGSPLFQFPIINKDSYFQELNESRLIPNKIITDHINKHSNPPKLFLSASGVSYYPSQKVVSEPYLSESYEIRGEPENLLQKLARDTEDSCKLNDGCSTLVYNARFGAIFGRNSKIFTILHNLYRIQCGFEMGNPNSYFHWIFIEDVCTAIKLLFDSAMHGGNTMPTFPPGPINFVSNYTENCTNSSLSKAFERVTCNRALANINPKLLSYIFTKDIAQSLFDQQNMIYPGKLIEMGFKFRQTGIDSLLDLLID
ncbi:MAG: hypothetical protein MHMPM18_000423 [Marteilia pararefringens]